MQIIFNELIFIQVTRCYRFTASRLLQCVFELFKNKPLVFKKKKIQMIKTTLHLIMSGCVAGQLYYSTQSTKYFLQSSFARKSALKLNESYFSIFSISYVYIFFIYISNKIKSNIYTKIREGYIPHYLAPTACAYMETYI